MYLYKIFGLVVNSIYECPELMPADDIVPDIFIREDVTPVHLENAVSQNNQIEGIANKLLIHIEDIASYLIEDGQSITVHPRQGATIENIRLFLLGSAMGALLHQRGILPLHGSAISVKNRAIAFSGRSGIGKSSLAAYLVRKGYNLLSDDICAITFTNGITPVVNPSMPQIKLCPDIVDRLGEKTIYQNPLKNKSEKYGWILNQQFEQQPIPLSTILIIHQHPDNQFVLKKLTGMDKFHALRSNLYRLKFAETMFLSHQIFSLLEKLATQTEVKLLLRPKEGFRIDELADFVLAHIDA